MFAEVLLPGMRYIIGKHKELWKNSRFVLSSVSAALFLIGSLIINYIAGTYATQNASNAVSDIILDNIPKINMDFMFVQVFFIFLFFVALLLVNEPRQIPFVLKSIALFVFIRSIFINLTNIGPYPDNDFLALNSDFIKKFTFGGDLFFSGHTGLPFLMSLIFWKNKVLRITFILTSIAFGMAVLLGHLHYSIDVFAAFFITEGIYRIAEKIFAKDHKLFLFGYN